MITVTQAIDALSGLLDESRESLETRTCKELARIAKQIGISRYSYMRKAEMLEAIWKELENARARLNVDENRGETGDDLIKNASEPNDNYQIPIEDISNGTYNTIRDVLVKSSNFSEVKEGILPIVAKVAKVESEAYEFSTVRSRRSQIHKHLIALAEGEPGMLRGDAIDAVEFFYQQLLNYQKEVSIEFNRQYQSRVQSANKKKTVEVQAKPILDLAIGSLAKLKTAEAVRWENVSIAVAMATGRRAVEIHSLGDFEPTNDPYALHFSGQAKTRDVEDAKDDYTIPTLLPAKDVLRGFEWLKLKGKRLPKEEQESDSRAVNKRYGKALTNAMKPFENAHYHSLRAMYAAILWHGLSDDEKLRTEKHSMYSEWLGHIERPGMPRTTFMSYMTIAVTDLGECVICLSRLDD